MKVNDIFQRFRRALARDFRNHRYEVSPEGILFPRSGLKVAGLFDHMVNGGPLAFDPNLIVNEGLTNVLNVALNGQSPVATWYIALFSGNVTPQASWTAANFDSNATEFTNYSEAARPEWENAAPSNQSIDNLSNRADFTVDTNGSTVYGAALLSDSTKGATTGTLFGATRFASSRDLDENDVLSVGYSVTASAA